ncbi:MAG: hypothetical protein LBQ92_00450, partial [Propionibacteriaceae bacterium]|nr:hypothetical protein [Propionibacteriaceae bacterium]
MALFERKSQDAEPAPAAPAAPAPSAAQIAASLAQVEAMAAGAPAPVKARVRSIAANLRQALPRLSNLEMGSYEVYSAMATATDYLPTALNAYLRLPRGWADTHPVAGGRTALLLLIDQLDLLDVASRRILDAANASDAQALLTHGIFLEGKFGEPGALRAARGFGIADSPTPGSFGELLAAGAGSL